LLAFFAIASLVACSRRSGGPSAGASTAPNGTGPGSAAAPLPPKAIPAFPTPAPAPEGAVSEVRTIAGIPPAQVMTTLGGRKGSGPTTERDCGTGPTASVQCADLVVARIPKTVASIPKVLVYARKHANVDFVGPCPESAARSTALWCWRHSRRVGASGRRAAPRGHVRFAIRGAR
jgi:hypothetical protein